MEQYRTQEATAEKTYEEIRKLEEVGWTLQDINKKKRYDMNAQSFYLMFSALLERADVAET